MSKTKTPIKEGWLHKTGGKFKSTKKRWFKLIDHVLIYSKASDGEELGRIHLSDVSKINTPKGKSILELLTPYRVWVLKADSDKDRDGWLAVLTDTKSEIKSRTSSRQSVSVSTPPQKVGVDDFDLLRTVGRGSFGKVLQVRKKDTGQIYAMKIVDKQHILDNNETEHAMAENKVLQMVHHPFLMNLYYSFQSETKLYFILDFVNGGEMYTHLQRERCFSKERVIYYAAEICLGLDHLHKNGIIYRDLKPENVLLSDEGHIIITDFGLSKVGLTKEDRTNTICGTKEYMAPEILLGRAYNFSVDWWSYGMLIYEMLSGLPPYYSEDTKEMLLRILHEPLSFPSDFNSDTRDLITKLLIKDPAARLQDPAQIKAHPFFKTINFEDLLGKRIKPPWIPELKGKSDVSQIDPEFLAESPDIEEENPENIAPEQQKRFHGFTFVQSNMPQTQTK